METVSSSCRFDGPAIRAVGAWNPENSPVTRCHQLLSDETRVRLSKIASIVRFKKGDNIYCDGKPASVLFNIISGNVKTYKITRDGSEHIVAFLYPLDLFGLSEKGRYANSAKALTHVTVYALPVSSLLHQLSRDSNLEFSLVEKLCHALRQSQDHALILTEKHGLPKLAMFLQTQERLQSCRGEPTGEIHLPMGRNDIAKYIGISPGALSRGFHKLAAHGVITNRDRHHVKIIDRKAFEELAGRPN